MAIERKRKCGYRKVGALYLVSDSAIESACDRLPINLTVCPVCGHGIKRTIGVTKIDLDGLVEGAHHINIPLCPEHTCPICRPSLMTKPQFLIFIGEIFYPTPRSFLEEAFRMRISRRISAIPRDLKLGESWVFLAHPKAGRVVITVSTPFGEIKEEKPTNAIFYAFQPQRIEKLIWQRDATSSTLSELERRNITPVIIPDGDPDHDPRKSILEDIREPPKATSITDFKVTLK